MEIKFETNRIENEYYDTRGIQKKYGVVFASGLEKMLGAISAAECAFDVKCMPQFRMHLMHAEYAGAYSLSPDNKKSKWRVLATCLDNNDIARKPNKALEEIKLLKETKKFRFGKIGDYHD